MLGFGGTQSHIDPTKLAVFVHDIKSTDTFGLAAKVWKANSRYVIVDSGNRKELIRFVFSKPTCVVWLQHDQGRTDTYELVLLWEGKTRDDEVAEVYVVSSPADSPRGDDTRAKSLLNAILTSPSIVPVNKRI